MIILVSSVRTLKEDFLETWVVLLSIYGRGNLCEEPIPPKRKSNLLYYDKYGRFVRVVCSVLI